MDRKGATPFYLSCFLLRIRRHSGEEDYLAKLIEYAKDLLASGRYAKSEVQDYPLRDLEEAIA